MDNLFDLKNIELDSLPFPHFGKEQIFLHDAANSLLDWFESFKLWSLTETDFYTQYEFSLHDIDPPESLAFLKYESTVEQFKACFKGVFALTYLELVDITAHKLLTGHRMGVHNDFINGDETHRLVIQINRNWSENNGGYLMLFSSKNPNDVAKVIQPLHNSAIGFEISEKSFHAVSTVHEFVRYTLVYTFKAINNA